MTYQAGIAISWPMLFICIYRYDQVKHDEDDTKVTKADDLKSPEDEEEEEKEELLSKSSSEITSEPRTLADWVKHPGQMFHLLLIKSTRWTAEWSMKNQYGVNVEQGQYM